MPITIKELVGDAGGTLNYVAKFTPNGFKLGVSQIFDNATNVGIAQASPTARLHVKGVDATSSNYALKVDDSADAPLIHVKNNGFIGVGTTSPTCKFQVLASFNQLGFEVNGVIEKVYHSYDGTNYVIDLNRNPATGTFDDVNRAFARILMLAGNNDSSIQFRTSPTNNNVGTTAMTIDKNGRINIGGTLGATSLLELSAGAIDGFHSNSTSNQAIYSYDAVAQKTYHYLNSNTYVIDINRNPSTGTFDDVNKAFARILLFSDNNDSSISFRTSPTNNNVGSIAMTINKNGNISMPLVQTGNASLSAGDLYVDTAANILANGDVVVGRKV